MSEIVMCGKCNGSGKYIYRSARRPCYSCNGSGKLKRTEHKLYKITINDETGNPFQWLNVKARSQAEAERKARKIGENGCFKNQLDTITAAENGTEYTYKPAK